MKQKSSMASFLVLILFLGVVCSSAENKQLAQDDFFVALIQNNTEQVIKAIRRGADVNRYSRSGETALNIAIEKRNIKLVKIFIEKGAHVNEKEKRLYYDTPLHKTASISSFPEALQIAQLLVSNGANINMKNKNGRIPLNFASSGSGKQTIKFIKFMLKNGAKVNSDMLCFINDIHIAEMLSAHGADINYVNKDGFTPLHYIIDDFKENEKKLQLIEFLLKKGAKANARTKRAGTFSLQKTFPAGSTPLGIARYYKHKKVMKLLKKYGGKY